MTISLPNVYNRFHPGAYNVGKEICIFCGSSEKLTKEHVFPNGFLKRIQTLDLFLAQTN
jgi:hypothetical protein